MTSQRDDLLALQKSVRDYDIHFTIELGEVEVHKRRVEASFLLDLRGRHNGISNCLGLPCPSCICVLRALLGVADAIRPFERGILSRPRDSGDKLLHFAAPEGREREVALRVEIRVRRPFAHATNGWALAFMEELTAVLKEFGCQDRKDFVVAESRSSQPVDAASRTASSRVTATSIGTESLLSA